MRSSGPHRRGREKKVDAGAPRLSPVVLESSCRDAVATSAWGSGGSHDAAPCQHVGVHERFCARSSADSMHPVLYE